MERTWNYNVARMDCNFAVLSSLTALHEAPLALSATDSYHTGSSLRSPNSGRSHHRANKNAVALRMEQVAQRVWLGFYAVGTFPGSDGSNFALSSSEIWFGVGLMGEQGV